MDPAERAVLREQLSLMAAGRGDGIDLDSPKRWVVEGLRDPVAFFRYLNHLIPPDSILYFEAIKPVPEVAGFYETHRAGSGAVCVVRDTIFPVPEVFHVLVRPGVIEGLVDLLSRHPQECCFTHVKAYRQEQLLFAFHDAFDGSCLFVSDRIPPDRVQDFCCKTGATCRREQNQSKRGPEVLGRLIWAMDNPDKVRILWPWWKKALFFWKR